MSMRLAAIAAIGLASPLHAAPLSEEFTSLFVIGDSLSDPGNLFAATDGATPESPPYFDGRFSDGPVFAEYLAEGFAVAQNFAFGGAQAVSDDDLIPDLPEQLAALSAVPEAAFGENGLATILLGANDLFAAIGSGAEDALVAENAADAVIDGARTVLDLGLSEVAVFTVPALAPTPLYTLFQPELSDEAAAATDAFNARLDAGLMGLQTEGLAVTRVDSQAFFATLLADPGAFGIEEATLPCIFPSEEAAAAFGQPQICDLATEAPQRAFFDSVHPNGVVHEAFADFAADAITAESAPVPAPAPIPVPAAGLLLLAGLGALGATRRRG